jgi:magnesium-protoporphyrin IX monomethyl ester (oxidative) cyclase
VGGDYMRTICLLNMPFSDVSIPSIALLQLKAISESCLPPDIAINVIDANLDFAKLIGLETYNDIALSLTSLYAGYGDWYFRPLAFPEEVDNSAAYLRRFLWSPTGASARMRDLVKVRHSIISTYLDHLIKSYDLDRSWIVGFTSMFMQTVPSIALAKELKARNPGIITAIGGANCEFPMGTIISRHISSIDYVFSGPGLRAFPALIAALADPDLGIKPESISGIQSYPLSAGHKSSGLYGEELPVDTELPLTYDAFLTRFESVFGSLGLKPSLPFETSRGCWWGKLSHCTFCGLNGSTMAYRAMQPDRALQQFKRLFAHADRVAELQSVDNILPKNYIHEVFKELDTPKQLSIFYEVKADLSYEDLAVLAKAGVTKIQPGIEALATTTLKLMKKGTTAYQNVRFLKWCSQLGITPSWNLLIGFPGEAEDTYSYYERTLSQLTHLPPPTGVYPVRFDRFSPYFMQSAQYGLKLRPMDFYRYIYPFSDDDLFTFAYYFVDSNLDAPYQQAMLEFIDRLSQIVQKWRDLWISRDLRSRPMLEYGDQPNSILDSRSGVMTEYTVTDTAYNILQLLEQPTAATDLASRLGVGSASVVSQLQEKGLLFIDSGRLVSLLVGKNSSNAK